VPFGVETTALVLGVEEFLVFGEFFTGLAGGDFALVIDLFTLANCPRP